MEKAGVRAASLNSVHRDDMTEFMTNNCCCGASGNNAAGVHESVSYRSQGNTTAASSVSTIPMSLSVPVPPPPSFRFRVGEYSEERKRSFVRLSRKYRQSRNANNSGQVRLVFLWLSSILNSCIFRLKMCTICALPLKNNSRDLKTMEMETNRLGIDKSVGSTVLQLFFRFFYDKRRCWSVGLLLLPILVTFLGNTRNRRSSALFYDVGMWWRVGE